MNRISDKQLGEIELRLSIRDRVILTTLRELRYAKTTQIQRLFFLGFKTAHTAYVMTNRVLNRLKKEGIITHLDRPIGGRNAGAGSAIWHLTEAGNRLLRLGSDSDKRVRYLEPSPTLLRHTIGVTECFVQLTEICRMAQNLTLKSACVEPKCWRSYNRGNKRISLRPDLYAETISGKFEDHWFLEIDLATEDVSVILEKCARYEEYYQTRAEQNTEGIFPYVLWIVPDEDRKRKITEALARDVGRHRTKLNVVITPNRLWTILTEGVKNEDLC